MTHDRYWAGLDGEGSGRHPHRYVLLASSDVDGNVRYVEDYTGLSTDVCLTFILNHPKMARLAGYFLGYDWTKILTDLPNESIYRLFRPELRVLPKDEGGGFSQVHWRGYRLHYLSGSMRVSRNAQTVTVWDLGKYYQTRFVEALRTWQITDEGSIAEIEAMKDLRGSFDANMQARTRAYCISECRNLARLATALEQAHRDIGLRPSVWHGPGSTAGAALKKMGIGQKRGIESIPREANHAIDCAFFGGRFEHSIIGTRDNVYGRDIASAYPYQAYHLPCLEHASWKKVRKESTLSQCRTAIVRFRLRDIGPVTWGPLPVRMPNGSIVYPRSGATGWCWLDEWTAARAHWVGLEFLEGWGVYTDCDCRPFQQVLEWYNERLRLGKEGRGIVLKLVLNSIYGKLAQSIGRPQYASRAWAGLITSGTRAQILRALAAHSSLDSVLAVATDGIYATENACLEQSRLADRFEAGRKALGSWETKRHGRMTFVRPGIYWSHEDSTLRARGMGRRKLEAQRELLLSAIEKGESGHINLGTSELFGGAKSCVYKLPDGTIKRSNQYGEWHDIPARVSLDPAPKRAGDWTLHRLPEVESAPYSKAGTSDDGLALARLADVFWGSR